MNDHEILVTIGTVPYTTTITQKSNTVIADEPQELGGQDEGFNPPALLLSSLGSCKAMTIKMYADRKKWNLEEVCIKLSYETLKSELQQNTYIQCHISFKGDLDQVQKERLLQIADKCPIHKIMSNPIIISSNLI
ncbi:OsmC family protein [Sphingobacterium sp. SG20118]|uniref:OsmC family protein n=1 Tax=Sphingobacterium TaxID=28453 RepID=UPI0004F89373|nr:MULTISPECIES: OsmC family protein [Sphingobacterium]AIM36779.1 osmotically inducible protein OsmC [Sphingobacterium sp. ML3W]MDH5827066.1 OsmC family protein [Sphingobacterium faecium]